MSSQQDRAVAICKLVELSEIQGARNYVLGYLAAHLSTQELEGAVHSASGFLERLAELHPPLSLHIEESAYDSH